MTFEQYIQKLKEAGEKATLPEWLWSRELGVYITDGERGMTVASEVKFTDAAFITLARNEWDTMISLLESYREALEYIKNGGARFGESANHFERILNMCEKASEALSSEPWREAGE